MNNKAINYLFRLLIQRFMGLLCFLIGSWWALDFRSTVYFGVYIFLAIISGVIMYRINPETLKERGKVNTNSPKWDKVLLSIYWILGFFIIYIVAGLEMDKAPQVGMFFWVGILLQIGTSTLALWALAVNTFLESTVRIQSDRNQRVCEDGPYKIVRHPTYTAVF